MSFSQALMAPAWAVMMSEALRFRYIQSFRVVYLYPVEDSVHADSKEESTHSKSCIQAMCL
jgi:hypothetical protein